MWSMRVTLDVSQLDTSALKLFKLWKSQLMSVMADTHQSAMGPYVTVAAAGSALNAWTAVCREALLVKVWDPWVQALVVKVFWIVQATSGGLGDGGGDEGDGGGGLGDGGGGDGDGGEGLGEGEGNVRGSSTTSIAQT